MHVPIVPLHQRVHISFVVMEIEINIDDEVPLFTQVMEQIKQAVSAGHCLPGSALPSIRQLSSDLEINSKTSLKLTGCWSATKLFKLKDIAAHSCIRMPRRIAQ